MQSCSYPMSKALAELFEPEINGSGTISRIPPPSRRLYTAEEIAPMFQVSEQWLLRHTRRAVAGAAIVPHIRIGKMIRFRLEDVQSHFEKHSIR
jgi:hypothetical protein